jgi:hypothetical protein
MPENENDAAEEENHMTKIIVDGKGIETEEKNFRPLSDEEAERASGGAGTAGSYHSRWVCAECGAHGVWDCERRVREYEQTFHYQQTGHFNFKTEGRYFDGPLDPYAD